MAQKKINFFGHAPKIDSIAHCAAVSENRLVCLLLFFPAAALPDASDAEMNFVVIVRGKNFLTHSIKYETAILVASKPIQLSSNHKKEREA